MSIISTRDECKNFVSLRERVCSLTNHVQKQWNSKSIRTKSGQFGLIIPYNKVKFFWSGLCAQEYSPAVAAEIAMYYGGVTLEMLLEQQNIKMCIYSSDNTSEAIQCRQDWDDLSYEYANSSRGEIKMIRGPCLRDTSTWNRVEKVVIEKNISNGEDIWGQVGIMEVQEIYCQYMEDVEPQSNEGKIGKTLIC
ncbi:unnamed protein product [Didymodactylos carnosus]|uniref:Uncharacterized protein n=1 Tax=Didymodactylos carnosus TaxID=1234261 RepID=A0A8S2E1R6_9BILA|nr:unnamed protein product [Didymodactylos carnosus]CAF3877239.1 unnamed protein product [Didymodactylos carnosus]